MKTKLSKRPNLKGRSIYISLVLCATVAIVTAVYGFGVATFFQGAAKTSLAENSKYLDWRALNVKHYSFLLDSSCSNHNAKNLRIEVRDGKTVWPRDENYPSMDELFQLIDSAKQKADQVTVYYHDLGFPRYASINWNEQLFDWMCGFTVEQFRILNGIGPIPTLHTKARIREPRFVLPEHAFLVENCCSLGPLRTTEERDKYLKQFIIPKSGVTDSF